MCDTGCVIPALPHNSFHLPMKNRWTGSWLAQDSVISKSATQGETQNCTWAEHRQEQQRLACLRPPLWQGKASKADGARTWKSSGGEGAWEVHCMGRGVPLPREGCARKARTESDWAGEWTRTGGVRQKIAWLVGDIDDTIRKAGEGKFPEQLSLSPTVLSPLCSLLLLGEVIPPSSSSLLLWWSDIFGSKPDKGRADCWLFPSQGRSCLHHRVWDLGCLKAFQGHQQRWWRTCSPRWQRNCCVSAKQLRQILRPTHHPAKEERGKACSQGKLCPAVRDCPRGLKKQEAQLSRTHKKPAQCFL